MSSPTPRKSTGPDGKSLTGAILPLLFPLACYKDPAEAQLQRFRLGEEPLPEETLPYYFQQSFRLARSLSQLFNEDSIDVIVPYGKGKELIGS